jgi:hypothetical protein
MIEDMTHLAVLDSHFREIQDLLTHYNSLASGKTDRSELGNIFLQRNAELTERLRQQTRALKYMLGLPYEPETHYAEAVLTGVGVGHME